MSALTRVREKNARAEPARDAGSNVDNAGWMTGFSGSNANVVVTPEEALFITDSRYTIQANEEVKGVPVASFASPVQMTDFVAEKLKTMGVNKIAFEANTTTYEQFENLKES